MARPSSERVVQNATGRTRITRLTRRGWVLLVAGVIALAAAYPSGRSELLPLGVLLAALPVVAWIYVRVRPLAFRATRTFVPSIVEAGATTAVQLDIANDASFRSPVGFWRDTWPWPPFVTEPAQLDPLQPGDNRYRSRGSIVRLQYDVAPTRRGHFDIGPLLIDFTDPFGLADGAIVAAGTTPLVVTPHIVDLPEGAVAIAADEGPTRMRQRRAYGGEDDLMTREYREGDAMRRVHWRASAHHGELMVRQEEQRSHAEARILLDTRRSNYRDARGQSNPDEPESESFEWAVSFCASLALYLDDRGFIVRVIETAEQQISPIEQFADFLESLAAIRLSNTPAERMSLLTRVARPDRSQGSVFAILSNPDQATIELLERQRASFDLAVVFLVDSWVSPIADRLRSAGWICVTVHPDDPIDHAWIALGVEQESTR
jgi:uncharacterized protein (DUF58 family)